MKRILLISTYYPPIQSIATNRIFSIAKYLDKDKYNVFVLTIDDGIKMPEEFELDNVTIYRIKNTCFFKKASFDKKTNFVWHKIKALYNVLLSCLGKDEYAGWTADAIRVGQRLIAEKQIDVVISSYAPLAPHLVALALKKSKPSLKWIADMRDEMSLNPYLTQEAKKKLKYHENMILQHADAVTSVSAPILHDFMRLANNPGGLFKEIRNGYDFELELNRNAEKNKRFTIIYAGSFYGDRKPDNFLKVLEQVVLDQEIKIKLIFVGVVNPLHIPDSLKAILEWRGKISHKETLELMKIADCLLLIIPQNDGRGVYTGKIFEYLGCLKPILALVPENDVAAALIRKVDAGYIAAYENMEKIKEKLLEAYNAWQNDKPFKPDMGVIKNHHRKEQIKRLEHLIEEITYGR